MKTITIDGIEYKLIPIPTEETTEEVYSDWRLPTIEELLTLVNYKRHNPACDLEDTASVGYWSSSTYDPITDNAWGVYFYAGSASADVKSDSYYVRCVRDGENGLEWSASSESTMSWNDAMRYAKNLDAPVYYKGECRVNEAIEILEYNGYIIKKLEEAQ